MRKFIADLMTAAMETAESHGHRMYRWRTLPYYSGSAISFCKHCGKDLSAMADPPVGTDEIGGSAHLVKCEGEQND